MSGTLTLDNAKAYFEQVTTPAFNEYIGQPSTFLRAFTVAMSLFSLYEWVYEFHKAAIDLKYGKCFASKGEFWKEVETQVPEAKFIRDLSNASKHVKLTISPSTSMTHIANTTIQVSNYGEGAYGAGRYGGRNVVMEDNGSNVSLDDCSTKVFNFWKTLLAEV